MVIVLLKKKNAAFALYQKEKSCIWKIHFIISFQYFINILVITVKADWAFVIYEGTLRRCILNMLWFFFKKNL